MLTMMLVALMTQEAGGAQVEACRSDLPAVAAIRDVASGIIEADNARDLARVLHYYAPTAILMPPNEPPVQGLDAIRPRYESLFAQFSPAIQGHVEEACVSGRFGMVRGSNGGAMRSRGGGQPRLLNDVYLMLLSQGADGAWRITHLMWHPK